MPVVVRELRETVLRPFCVHLESIICLGEWTPAAGSAAARAIGDATEPHLRFEVRVHGAANRSAHPELRSRQPVDDSRRSFALNAARFCSST